MSKESQQKNNLDKLVTSVETTERLQKLGISCVGVMADVMGRNCFTSEEIKIMIGTEYNDAPLNKYRHPSLMTGNYENTFVVYFPDKMKEYNNRSNASSQILIYLLESGEYQLEDVVRRFETWKRK